MTRSPSTPAARRSSPRRSSARSRRTRTSTTSSWWGGRRSAGAARSSRSCNWPKAQSASDDELIEICDQAIARYKVPKAFIRIDKVVRSPAGKADYRWAKEVAMQSLV